MRTSLRLLATLLAQGITPDLDEAAKKRLRLTNILALFGALVMFGSIPFDRLNAPAWMVTEDAVGGIAFLTLPLLLRLGFPTGTRVLLLLVSNLIVLGNAVLLGRDSGAAMVLIALCAIPFALFDLRERWPLILGILMPVACFVLAESNVLARFAMVPADFSTTIYHMYSGAVTLIALLFSLLQTSLANTRAERALRESREYYRLVTEAASDAIITVDEDDRIVFASPATQAIFGHTPAEIEGQPFSSLTTAPAPRVIASAQVQGLRRDGTTFPMEISVGEFRHGTRRIRTAVLRDISDRVRAERELDQTRQTSIHSAKMAALGEMSGNIAHEVNNPLAAILLRTHRLLNQTGTGAADPETVAKAARDIEKTVHRIAKIVDALRTFARDVAGDPLRPESVRQIVTDTVELCAQRFHHHGITLRIDDIADDLYVQCRGVQISQILLNLLSNAHDAVEREMNAWVRISAAPVADDAGEDAGKVRLQVTDSGPGIPADVVPRIMEPFFTTKGVGKGTGLGLSVSRGLAESHGGRLEYAPDGTQSRFVLTLTRSPAGTSPASQAALPMATNLPASGRHS